MSGQSAFPYLQCADCGHREPLDHPPETCSHCGGGWLDVVYDYERLAREWPEGLRDRPWDMWRYQELLPLLDATHRVTGTDLELAFTLPKGSYATLVLREITKNEEPFQLMAMPG